MSSCIRLHSKLRMAALALTLTIGHATAPAQMPELKVVVTEARLLDATATTTLVGTVGPVRRSRIASEIAGNVREMSVRQGDLIEAGGIICRLNDDTVRFQLAGAEARLAALEARRAELVAGTRPGELKRLKALLDLAAANLDRWEAEKARVERLYEGSDSNAKEVYDTRADYQIALQNHVAAEASYELGVEGPRVEVIASAEHDVAEQRAVRDRLRSDLEKTVIRAPFTGYIVDRTVEIGEWVSDGGQVVELIDLTSVLVRVDAPEAALPYARVGDAARVQVDAVGRNLSGVIKHVIRQAQRNSRTFPIEIEIDNPDMLLAAGMFARVTIPSGPKEQVVAVPQDAIVEREGIPYIAMIMPDARGGMSGVRVAVTLGADVGDWVAITSGNVKPGTVVATRGTEGVLPFPSPVTVVDENGTPVAMPGGGGGHGSDKGGHGGERSGRSDHEHADAPGPDVSGVSGKATGDEGGA